MGKSDNKTDANTVDAGDKTKTSGKGAIHLILGPMWAGKTDLPNPTIQEIQYCW